jgi:hypothetical protein
MAQITQQPRVANANSRQKPTDTKKPATPLQVVAKEVEKTQAQSPAVPGGDDDGGKRTPSQVIQGAIGNTLRSLTKTIVRTAKWEGTGEASVDVTSMKTALREAKAAVEKAAGELMAAQTHGFAPAKMSSGSAGSNKKAAMAAGDAVKLGAKHAPSFVDVLTEEEMDSLVVGSITKTGKVVVIVKNTNRMIGVFAPKALVRQ